MADRVRFSEFELDLRSLELRKRGVRSRLAGQPIDVLALLIERPGEMVSREELRAALWPSDTFVDFEHGLNTAISRLRKALGDVTARPRFVETLPRRGYRFVAALEHLPAERAGLPPALLQAPKRVAVLPFDNLSGDPGQEHVSDGLTEEIITQLACLPSEDLAVIARTSVMRFKGGQTPLAGIAAELRADYVIEGSVRRSGDRLRVTAQLIHVGDQCHVWARSFDCDLGDILEVQSAVARAVAETTALQLSPARRAGLTTTRPVNAAAYEACLKGRYFWNRYGPDDFLKAIACFEDAIRLAPDLAAAYAGLADAHIMRAFTGMAPPADACEKARTAAGQALARDPELAESRVAMGWVRMTCDYDWIAAEADFRRAVLASPGSTRVLHFHSIFLSAIGRHDEAIARARHAVDLDPLSPLAYTNLAWRLANARRFDEACAGFLRALDLEPRFGVALLNLGEIWAQQGRHRDALDIFRRIEADYGREAPTFGMLACAYAMAGDRERARAVLDATLHRAATSYVPPYYLATGYLWLGERDAAVEWLEKAMASRDPWMVFVATDMRLDPLRADPRFLALQAKMGVPSPEDRL